VCSANALEIVDTAQSGTFGRVQVKTFGRQPSGTFNQLNLAAYP
jgi:hypothetical protein